MKEQPPQKTARVEVTIERGDAEHRSNLLLNDADMAAAEDALA